MLRSDDERIGLEVHPVHTRKLTLASETICDTEPFALREDHGSQIELCSNSSAFPRLQQCKRQRRQQRRTRIGSSPNGSRGTHMASHGRSQGLSHGSRATGRFQIQKFGQETRRHVNGHVKPCEHVPSPSGLLSHREVLDPRACNRGCSRSSARRCWGRCRLHC